MSFCSSRKESLADRPLPLSYEGARTGQYAVFSNELSHATATFRFPTSTFFVHFKMNMYLNQSQRLVVAMQHLLKHILKTLVCPYSLVQYSTAQHSTAQHSTAQHSTAQHSTAQHSTAQHSTAQHSTAQHSTAQHSTAQHSTAQHSTAQHSTAQHSTAQHSTAQHSTVHAV